MHKFTVFSILLSLSVVLVLLDVLTHNYLARHELNSPSSNEVSLETEAAPTEATTPSELSPEASDGLAEDGVEPTGLPTELPVEPQVELQSVDEVPSSWLTVDRLVRAGVQAPVLKSTPFSDLIFQFLPYEEPTQPLQWNLFDGETYVGTVVEMVSSTETEGFQTYLHLREAASRSSDLGSVNEVNNYGDASFYFNHLVQTKTVRLVIRYDKRVFAFEYRADMHEIMKKLFDILKQAK